MSASVAGTAPDIRTDMLGWFNYHDPHGRGLNQREILRAILNSLNGEASAAGTTSEAALVQDPRSLHSCLLQLWPLFDTDGSGTIDAREFTQPGGLGETILAHIQHSNPSSAVSATDPSNSGSASSQQQQVTPGQVDEICCIFPHLPRPLVARRLIENSGDKEATIESLLIAPAAAATGSVATPTGASSSSSIASAGGQLSALPAPPQVAVVGGVESTQQCSSCHNSSRIQLPSVIAPGTTAVAWQCGTCHQTNHISLEANNGSNISSYSSAPTDAVSSLLPPPPPFAPKQQQERVPESSPDWELPPTDYDFTSVPTGLPAIDSKQCSSCGNTCTIQLPSVVPVGVKAVAWRCPNCAASNAVPIIASATLDSSSTSYSGSSNQQQLPLPTAPPAAAMHSALPAPPAAAVSSGHVPSGLPAESTQQCSSCQRASRIGLPATVAAGVTAVAWCCPNCQHSNQVPIIPPSQHHQQQQQSVPTGLPHESRRECSNCRSSARIQLPISVAAGVTAVAWRCPTCKFSNEVAVNPPPQQQQQQSAAGVRVPTGLPSESRRECSCCRKCSRVQLPADVPAGVDAVAWRCPKCSFSNEVAVLAASNNNYSSSSTAATAVVFRPRPGLREQPAPPSSFYSRSYSNNSSSGQQRRALLVGINYRGTRAQLRGCVNDVRNVRRLLLQTFHWPSHCIKVLADERIDECDTALPNRANIIDGLRWLVAGANPGDALFLHFSGHGAQQPDPHGVEEDGMNETLVPLDFNRAGMISDDEISSIVVQPLPEGVRLTALMDCCHSGTGLDLPYTWTVGRGSRGCFVEETNPYHSLGDVQLFSGCEDGATSADAASAYSSPGGAMTTAFCDVLRDSADAAPTYVQLLQRIQRSLKQRGFKQRPQLSSSQRFEIDRPFLLEDAVPNSNRTIGRTMRKKFKARRRRFNNDFFSTAMGVGVGAVGGLIIADFLF